MKIFKAQYKTTGLYRFAKPLLTVLVIMLILHYSGMLAGVTGLTNSQPAYSGKREFSEESTATTERFNYDFMVKDMDGNRFSFTDYKGKVVFLNLWATWCGPCRAEMPGIQSLYSKIKNENVRFVMLSIDEDRQQAKVKKYVSDKRFTFPVFMPSGQLTQQLSVPSIPTTFIINKYGIVVQKKIGTTNFDTPKFKKFLEDLAAE
ncbi:MAG: TlpA family protein disulfide reductase [Flammeovirgaceae bacterium]|nr:MAG: TlpA family protein disulfide reductase [Flammeovirgaceae bacterium]